MSDKENEQIDLDNSNVSANADCTGGCHGDNKNAQYLLVDYGERLVSEIEASRLELHKQAVSILEKVDLLWEVIRAFITFILPVITGLGLTLLAKTCLPNSLAPWFFTVFVGLTVSLIFLNLPPLAEAVGNYLTYKVYTPQFTNCQCDTCKAKRDAASDIADKASIEESVVEDNATPAEDSDIGSLTSAVPNLNETE